MNHQSVASVRLRNFQKNDLPTFYELQLDPEANHMAQTYPRNAEAFEAYWANILDDSNITVKAITWDDELVGCISCFPLAELDTVGYWISRNFWGRGIATQALLLLLEQISIRPLRAHVAVSNAGSIRVLQKCGFQEVQRRLSPATERYMACEEAIFELP